MRGPAAPRFSPHWLALRAAYDERSRAVDLLPLFADALDRDAQELRFVDLGAGTAANFLYLAPRLAALVPSNQTWRLVDRDPAMLDRASARIAEQAQAQGWRLERTPEGLTLRVGDHIWKVAFQRLDLAGDMEALSLADREAVVLSALLDLVSPAWLRRFVDWMSASRSPMLATLTYDGLLEWHPGDRDDDRIRALFNDHQRRDKGFGPAVGPAARNWLETRLIAAGYTLEDRSSPWRLGPEDAAILNALIETISESAAEQDPQARRLAAGWAMRRKTQADAGILSATIGHVDILARP